MRGADIDAEERLLLLTQYLLYLLCYKSRSCDIARPRFWLCYQTNLLLAIMYGQQHWIVVSRESVDAGIAHGDGESE